MTADAIIGALDDSIAIVQEHGADLDDTLAALKLPREQVEAALTARWEAAPEGTDLQSFVHGFTEGLMAGRKL